MRKTLLLFATAVFICLAITVHAHVAPAPGIFKQSFNMASLKAFDQYTTMLAKAKPLHTSTTKTALTNSSLTNNRPSGYSMVIPVFEVYRSGGTDYYYTDNVDNGATVYFDVPNTATVNIINLYQLGQNFHNWEWSDLTTNGGSTYVQGYADPGGQNYIFYWDGNGPYDIIGGINVIVY